MPMRHFLADDDLTPQEQAQILRRAIALKAAPFRERQLEGPQVVSVLFDKPTLRTQVSFVGAITGLGGYPMIVDASLAQVGERESIADVARVLGPQSQAIVWRTYGQDRIEEMARYAGVPVINALTDDYHPCQILADLMTIQEQKGSLAGLTVAYVGDGGNNMAHSYLLGCALAGMHLRIGTPASHQPKAQIVERAQQIADRTGASIRVGDDPVASLLGADVVITDTWVSMGMEAEKDDRQGEGSPFEKFSVTPDLMGLADPAAIFLHCLPAYRGHEVSADVIDGPQSAVWDEAENRLHAQKAVIAFLLDTAREAV